jgi:hypothetical protein
MEAAHVMLEAFPILPIAIRDTLEPDRLNGFYEIIISHSKTGDVKSIQGAYEEIATLLTAAAVSACKEGKPCLPYLLRGLLMLLDSDDASFEATVRSYSDGS